MLDDREIVGDHDIRQIELRLQVGQEIDDLRLDGDIQGRDRLVGDDELRFRASARAIPIRWRCPPENSCGYLRPCSGDRPTFSSRKATRAVLSLGRTPCTSKGSDKIEFTVSLGFKDE